MVPFIKRLLELIRKVNVVDLIESGYAIAKIVGAGIKAVKTYFDQAKTEVEKITKPTDDEAKVS